MARPFTHLPPEIIRQGPPLGAARGEVLLIHGAWHGPWCWDGLAEPLAARGFGVNRLCLPGHGESPWELPCLTGLADYADLARRAAAGLGRPVLVGHSLGGWLVMKVLEVADLPAVLLMPLPPRGLPLTRLARLFAQFPAAMAPVLALGRLRVRTPVMSARLFFTPQAPPPDLDGYWRRLVPEPGRVALEMGLGLAGCRPRPGRSPRLVVAGGRDYFLPAGRMRRLAARLGAEFALLPAAGHNPWPVHLPALLERLAAFPPLA